MASKNSSTMSSMIYGVIGLVMVIAIPIASYYWTKKFSIGQINDYFVHEETKLFDSEISVCENAKNFLNDDCAMFLVTCDNDYYCVQSKVKPSSCISEVTNTNKNDVTDSKAITEDNKIEREKKAEEGEKKDDEENKMKEDNKTDIKEDKGLKESDDNTSKENDDKALEENDDKKKEQKSGENQNKLGVHGILIDYLQKNSTISEINFITNIVDPINQNNLAEDAFFISKTQELKKILTLKTTKNLTWFEKKFYDSKDSFYAWYNSFNDTLSSELVNIAAYPAESCQTNTVFVFACKNKLNIFKCILHDSQIRVKKCQFDFDKEFNGKLDPRKYASLVYAKLNSLTSKNEASGNTIKAQGSDPEINNIYSRNRNRNPSKYSQYAVGNAQRVNVADSSTQTDHGCVFFIQSDLNRSSAIHIPPPSSQKSSNDTNISQNQESQHMKYLSPTIPPPIHFQDLDKSISHKKEIIQESGTDQVIPNFEPEEELKAEEPAVTIVEMPLEECDVSDSAENFSTPMEFPQETNQDEIVVPGFVNLVKDDKLDIHSQDSGDFTIIDNQDILPKPTSDILRDMSQLNPSTTLDPKNEEFRRSDVSKNQTLHQPDIPSNSPELTVSIATEEPLSNPREDHFNLSAPNFDSYDPMASFVLLDNQDMLSQSCEDTNNSSNSNYVPSAPPSDVSDGIPVPNVNSAAQKKQPTRNTSQKPQDEAKLQSADSTLQISQINQQPDQIQTSERGQDLDNTSFLMRSLDITNDSIPQSFHGNLRPNLFMIESGDKTKPLSSNESCPTDKPNSMTITDQKQSLPNSLPESNSTFDQPHTFDEPLLMPILEISTETSTNPESSPNSSQDPAEPAKSRIQQQELIGGSSTPLKTHLPNRLFPFEQRGLSLTPGSALQSFYYETIDSSTQGHTDDSTNTSVQSNLPIPDQASKLQASDSLDPEFIGQETSTNDLSENSLPSQSSFRKKPDDLTSSSSFISNERSENLTQETSPPANQSPEKQKQLVTEL